MIAQLLHIFLFPGFLFLAIFGLAAEFVDRKLYARLQNRIGPPWFQPVADLVKLVSKEEVIPEDANPRIFRMMPVLALASSVTAFFYIPCWGGHALMSFYGDIIVVLYLLTVPTLALFLGGWYSTSLYSRIGAVRSLTQLFAYEVPLFMSMLAPALLADSWSLKEIAAYYGAHPLYMLFNILGFAISITALLGKLEKVPFDIAEAETEIVAGTLTEYSGRLLGIFRLSLDIEAVVASSLVAAVFIPVGLALGGPLGFVIYVAKVLVVIFILAVLRTIFARLRIDQMMVFCWKYLAPLAFVQLLLSLVLKGVLHR